MDGHNSHYTRGFLQYARKNRIHILCYPAHTTHVYQGLDVVVFAVLKRSWSEERDKWEREKGEGVTKANFITIYGRAHLRALTPDLIRTAFRKTGVWPFDCDVVPSNMLAPSKETSTKSYLPIAPSTPVKILANALQRMSTQLSDNGDEEHSVNSSSSTQEDLETIIKQLAETSLSKLVSSTPMNSQTDLRHATAHTISPIKKSRTSITNIHPTTTNEVLLLAALHDAEAANAALKKRVIALQASNILNEMYCAKIRSQLAHQESKKQAGNNGGKILGDGLPRLLSGDVFYERVVQFEEAQTRAAAEKRTRTEERKRHAEALADWKKLEDARKAENKARREHYHEALKIWESEKARAKEEKWKLTEKKPTLGKLIAAIPRPKVIVTEECESDGECFDLDDIGSCASDEY